MWIMLNDAFLSIVQKDCPVGSLLVRARRAKDIKRVFGKRVKIVRTEGADYLFRAVVSRSEVVAALENEVEGIDYGNFKDSVRDTELHSAYLNVWTAMAAVQHPPPYSGVK